MHILFNLGVDARCLVGIQCIFHVAFYHNYVICAGVEFHLVYEGITGESMTTVLPFYFNIDSVGLHYCTFWQI